VYENECIVKFVLLTAVLLRIGVFWDVQLAVCVSSSYITEGLNSHQCVNCAQAQFVDSYNTGFYHFAEKTSIRALFELC
jgi:hypothetical protein